MNINLAHKIKLPKIAKSHPIAFWVAVVLHLLLLFGLIFSNVQRWEIPQEKPKTTSKVVPKAITIDLNTFNKEKQRVLDLKKQKALKLKREEERLRKLEDKRYKKQKKINQLKAETKKAERKKNLAKKKALEAEKQKKEAEAQAKKAKAKTKEAERKKNLAKKKAKEAEKQKRKIEQQRANESKKFQTEQDKRKLTHEIQDEENQDRKIIQEDILNKLKISYINQIGARVEANWSYYQGAKDDWSCKVYVLQDLDGSVKSVDVKSCKIDDNTKLRAFKNSIERAVFKASPLPHASDPSVFDNEIEFTFRAN